MKTLTFGSKTEWLAARHGRITGSRLKDIVVKRGTGKKIGFFEVIAELLMTNESDGLPETPMERGIRLEPEAMAAFEEHTGREVDKSLVLWVRDDDEGIAVSPDGFIGDTEAVECKCLSSARHIEAYVNRFIWGKPDFESVPDEYQMQVVQYFIVNESLKTLYMVFFDPRVTQKEYFFLTVGREAVEQEIAGYLEYQRSSLKEIAEIVEKITTTNQDD